MERDGIAFVGEGRDGVGVFVVGYKLQNRTVVLVAEDEGSSEVLFGVPEGEENFIPEHPFSGWSDGPHDATVHDGAECDSVALCAKIKRLAFESDYACVEVRLPAGEQRSDR